jgi:hypothetical protein
MRCKKDRQRDRSCPVKIDPTEFVAVVNPGSIEAVIGAVPLKNVTSRFAMEKIKSVTALPVPAA